VALSWYQYWWPGPPDRTEVDAVPIVADIEDLAPAEFLLMLSLTSKTGKLSCVWQGNKTLLMLREGSIVYAAAPSVRERLGSMLVNRGLVSEEQLLAALETQKSSSEPGLLGSILVDIGAVSQEHLREVVQDQFKSVLVELLSWEGGVMIFEGANIPDLGAVHVDPADVLVGIGVDTDLLVRSSLTRLDRSQIDAAAKPAPPVPPPVSMPESEPVAPVEQAGQSADRRAQDEGARAAVRSLMKEMGDRSFSLTAEMTLAILGSAGEVVDRAVLFLVHPRHLGVVGGFGLDSDGRRPSGNKLRISRAHRSIFTDVIEVRETFRGPVEEIEGNVDLLKELGDNHPTEAIAIPLIVNDEVVAVVYGDGGEEGSPIGRVESLEATLGEVGMASEAVRQ
jgi:hypothetical protein